MKNRKRNILKNAVITALCSMTFLFSGIALFSSSVTIRDYSTWKVVYRSMSHKKAEKELKQLDSIEPRKYVLVDEWSGKAHIPWMQGMQ